MAGVGAQRTMSLDDVPDSVATLLATRLDLVDALALASTCRRFWRAAGAVAFQRGVVVEKMQLAGAAMRTPYH